MGRRRAQAASSRRTATSSRARSPYGGSGLTWMLAGIGGHAVRATRSTRATSTRPPPRRGSTPGTCAHGVFVPASDTALVDAWFRLSFGAAAALATRETTPRAAAGADRRDPARHAGRPRGRRAPGRRDERLHAGLAELLDRQLETHEELRRGMARTPGTRSSSSTSSPSATARWSATSCLYKRPHDLRVPRDSIDLAAASTVPEARGSGAGRRADRARPPLGARARLPDDDHGLADDEPPRVAVLAEARLPPELPAAAIERCPDAHPASRRVEDRGRQRRRRRRRARSAAAARARRGRRRRRARLAALSARGRAARDARHARRARDARDRAAGAAGSRRHRWNRVRPRSPWPSTSSSGRAIPSERTTHPRRRRACAPHDAREVDAVRAPGARAALSRLGRGPRRRVAGARAGAGRAAATCASTLRSSTPTSCVTVSAAETVLHGGPSVLARRVRSGDDPRRGRVLAARDDGVAGLAARRRARARAPARVCR